MLKDLTYPIPWEDTWNIVDSTKLTTFMDCPRRYFYEYILGWRSTAPNNHLVFGSAWHKAQEHLLLQSYTQVAVDEAMFLFMNEYRKELPEETDELYGNKTPDKAYAALKQYASYYANDLSNWEVLYTEVAGTVLITPEDVMSFRLDSILRERDSGMYLSLDHKTGSKKGRTWTDKWTLLTPIGLYTHVLYCLYPEDKVRGVKVRGTFFYKSKPAEFEDVPCWKSKDQMQTWLWSTTYWYNALKLNIHLFSKCTDSDDIMMAFPMQTESCTKYFGCPYHDFCTSWNNPLQRCEEPPLGFKIERWDPLLEESTHKMEIK